MSRDRLYAQLAEAIAADPALMKEGWHHLALVSVFEEGSPDMAGFCYLDGGRSMPVAPSDFGIFDVLEQLRDAMAAADGGAPWVATLIRIERATGEMTAAFEYHDADRWAITPANVGQRAVELAPG